MSSGYSGGVPDFFSASRRSTAFMPSNTASNTYTSKLNPQHQYSSRLPLAGIIPDTAVQIHRSDSIGKRSLAELQQQQSFLQSPQGLGFYPRNVKHRPNFHHAYPVSPLSSIDLSPISSISSVSNSVNLRYGVPILQQNRPQPLSVANRNAHNVFSRIPLPNSPHENVFASKSTVMEVSAQESEKNMMNHRLQELEKQLLGDEEDGEAVSVVTNSEWSETIQNLIDPSWKTVSLSPTSSSSSCSSTCNSPPLPSPKQALIDATAAINDGKPEAAAEILTRLQAVANTKGTSEQRLAAYTVLPLKSRLNPIEHPPSVSDLDGSEHAAATQMLFDVSPCFRYGFMAANLAILDATEESGYEKIHVLDFEIGQGRQYVHLLHALAAKAKQNNKTPSALRVTAVTNFSGKEKQIQIVGDSLKALANKIGVCFNFHSRDLKINDLSLQKLELESDEALAINFAFKLYKLPDESVTTENLRDDLLRRVRALSPTVLTLVEQEMNSNTAPLIVRVREACDYYGAVLESLDATVPRNSPDRARIEEGLGRRIGNLVACEGRDRVERCEMFGKWRARLGMAGFQPRPMSQLAAELLRSKLNSGTRGSHGFSVVEESGGIGFGWMGRTLTVSSAWR